MKRIFFVAVMVLVVVFAREKANAFEVSEVRVGEEKVVLWTTYGGDISLERGQNASPLIIDLNINTRFVFIQEFLKEEPIFLLDFPNKDDFRAFLSFLERTSHKIEPCHASILVRNPHIFYVFF